MLTRKTPYTNKKWKKKHLYYTEFTTHLLRSLYISSHFAMKCCCMMNIEKQINFTHTINTNWHRFSLSPCFLPHYWEFPPAKLFPCNKLTKSWVIKTTSIILETNSDRSTLRRSLVHSVGCLHQVSTQGSPFSQTKTQFSDTRLQ